MRLTVWVAIAGLAAACDDDVLNMQRADIGVADTGVGDPLALEVGMSFQYRAQLTYRDSGAANEGSSIYEIEVAIQSVEDRGAGQSALGVTVTGTNLLAQDWTDNRDFDLWVARLGPARRVDQVDLAPITVNLDGAPTLPPAPSPTKSLPQPDSFFLDFRALEGIRADFNQSHADRQPRIVDPSSNTEGEWIFSYDGPDDSVFFFSMANQRRAIRLQFDPRGFLTSLSEEVGAESPGTPRATANLQLISGP